MMNFGNSPLLDMGTSQQQPQMMDAELQKMYEAIQHKRASINTQAQQSSTPLWDEIDKIEVNLTGAQRQHLIQNQEYVNSLQYVSKPVHTALSVGVSVRGGRALRALGCSWQMKRGA